MPLASFVILLLGVALLATAVLLARSTSRLPWTAIVVAALASAVCFTVGGFSDQDTSGPSIATVMGSIAGLLSVLAAILALVPSRSRAQDGRATRTPILLCSGGTALGAIGLLLSLVTG